MKNKKRTTLQNRALYLYFRLVANALNDANKGMLQVLKSHIEIPWSRKMVERYLWTPILDSKDYVVEAQIEFEKQLGGRIELQFIPSLQDIKRKKPKTAWKIYFGLIAEALNDAGQDMRVVLPTGTQIWWDKDTVKNFLWRPVQKYHLNKISTKELNTKELDIVYEIVDRHLSKHINTINFPSIQDLIYQEEYEKRNK